jgi:hypothetical protein
VRCELAVAATAAGDRAAAQRALRGRPRCPGDLLAILTTAASGDENAFRKLTPLARKSRLAAEVASLVASRIAADAYAAGHPDKARRYLAIAGKGTLAPKAGVAIRYDQALLDLDAGRDGAAAQLEALAGEVPEAWIALALAAERKGDPVRSLAYLRKAADAKVDFPPLKEWIHAKARLLEETP